MIKINNLSKKYNIPHERKNTFFEMMLGYIKSQIDWEEFYALKDISFEIKKGEIIGLIGKNGSGKTTLLKIISGIIPPTEGKVEIDGKVAPFLSLGIGFHHELTAKENLYIYGAVLGLTRKEVNEKLSHILDFAGVKRFEDTKLKHYSSGMQARLAFSMMIQTDPEILIVDEIFAVGDKDFRPKCISVFQEYKEKNKTVLFSSHSLRTIKNFCDRVILLEDGKITKIGNPEDVVNYYANKK
ncbi:MAG: ABC transporter ATP-binding protein [Candidatus Paceibacterota bacterium]